MSSDQEYFSLVWMKGPEGPVSNSHARQGVDQGLSKAKSAEGATRIDWTNRLVPLPAHRASEPSQNHLAHALTGMAIKYRPFGRA